MKYKPQIIKVQTKLIWLSDKRFTAVSTVLGSSFFGHPNYLKWQKYAKYCRFREINLFRPRKPLKSYSYKKNNFRQMYLNIMWTFLLSNPTVLS